MRWIAAAAAAVVLAGCSGPNGAEPESVPAAPTTETLPQTPDPAAARGNIEWVNDRVEVNQAAFCDDIPAARKKLRTMHDGGITREQLDAGLNAGCESYEPEPTPAPTPEPTPEPTETESPDDRVVDSFRFNLRMMRDGGYCDMYPAYGKASTVDGLAMLYPDVADAIGKDAMWDMLEKICTAAG